MKIFMINNSWVLNKTQTYYSIIQWINFNIWPNKLFSIYKIKYLYSIKKLYNMVKIWKLKWLQLLHRDKGKLSFYHSYKIFISIVQISNWKRKEMGKMLFWSLCIYKWRLVIKGDISLVEIGNRTEIKLLLTSFLKMYFKIYISTKSMEMLLLLPQWYMFLFFNNIFPTKLKYLLELKMYHLSFQGHLQVKFQLIFLNKWTLTG